MAPSLVFDRGTILLRDLPPGLDASSLPGVRWDQRVGSPRALARFHQAIATRLAALGVGVEDRVRPPLEPSGGLAVPELRPYQEAALQAWELAGRRGLVVLPTGSGKTRVAMVAIARAGRPALVLVPTRLLLDQWCTVLEGVLGASVGRYGDGDRALRPLTVATYESAWRHMPRIGNRFDLLVVDEAHHFGGGMRDEALEMSTAGFRLGLTATPPVPRGGRAAALLEELVGPVAFELGIADLSGRFLADFELVELRLSLTPEERAAHLSDRANFREVLARFGDLVPKERVPFEQWWSDFLRWAGRSAGGRAAIAAWRRGRKRLALTSAKLAVVGTLLERHRDARTLVFTADKEAALRIAREHLVMPITADVRRAEREEAIAAFRDGRIRSIVSARVLNEGFDVPDADVGIVVGGAHGEREHVQCIGRLLRPAPGKRAIVYELVTGGTEEVLSARRRRGGLRARGARSL